MRLTYAKCVELLGKRERKKLAGNTYLYRLTWNVFAVRFHQTDVLFVRSDGTVTVHAGGHRTVTTKDRLNTFGPFRVYQRKHVWYATVGGVEYAFRDGLTADVDDNGAAVQLSERVPLTSDPEEIALTDSVRLGECPAGVVTDWRREKGLIPV